GTPAPAWSGLPGGVGRGSPSLSGVGPPGCDRAPSRKSSPPYNKCRLLLATKVNCPVSTVTLSTAPSNSPVSTDRETCASSQTIASGDTGLWETTMEFRMVMERSSRGPLQFTAALKPRQALTDV